ncbi:MAG: hypothetical protein R3C26_24710 [Calditrichia bacterium]
MTEKTVIGVQLQADETYRNYPHTEKLVEALSSFTVLIFDAKPISGFHLIMSLKLTGSVSGRHLRLPDNAICSSRRILHLCTFPPR